MFHLIFDYYDSFEGQSFMALNISVRRRGHDPFGPLSCYIFEREKFRHLLKEILCKFLFKDDLDPLRPSFGLDMSITLYIPVKELLFALKFI
jgi:hypothetical protein